MEGTPTPLVLSPLINQPVFSTCSLQVASPPMSPVDQGARFACQQSGYLSPVLSPTSTPITQGFAFVPTPAEGGKTMIVKLDKYVPPATNPNETLEEKNFRHALPPRLLHKHKAWVEQQLGPHSELIINVPPGLVELSRKRLSRGDSRYKGLADMNIEAKIVGRFDPVYANGVLDNLFIGNKRTVKSSRRRCFEVINSVKHLTETTGAFVISRPVDECVDIYGPQHVVESAIAYLLSMQSQSGVSKRVIRVSTAAASAIIKARRSILPREQGSLFVEPPPRGEMTLTQSVTIYAYVDSVHLDLAEDAIRKIEREVDTVEDSEIDIMEHIDPCEFLLPRSVSNSISHSPPPLLEELEDECGKRRPSLAPSPKALLHPCKMDGESSPKGRAAAVLKAIQQDVLAPQVYPATIKPHALHRNDVTQFHTSTLTPESSQGLSSPQVSSVDDSVLTPPTTPLMCISPETMIRPQVGKPPVAPPVTRFKEKIF
eukprot:TRINITY_DN13093_c0_g1_i1.p1 TRINITY_DN13093_c0_g1~~TRINITY_DN13093_c0_g1_i1.p1  ORF type:complete len:486 (+),score=101.84 TRINITY_DN13093_c0_g1_i1:45-1502(+)